MQEHDNQILVPPSFIALHADARGQLRATPDHLRQRYELCEDLANLLVDQAQTLYHVQAPSEAEILRRMHAGLAGGGAGLAPGEAAWVVSRLAELLGWPCPVLPEAGDAPPEHAA
jgi:hypothetical protein